MNRSHRSRNFSYRELPSLAHPHEHRFDFDFTHIKTKYPEACQYFITDAKGVHKIEPHIVRFPPKIHLDHSCYCKGSYFQKPKEIFHHKSVEQNEESHSKAYSQILLWL